MNGAFYQIMFIIGSALLILGLLFGITSAKLYLSSYDYCNRSMRESAESLLRASGTISLCGCSVIVFAGTYHAAHVLCGVIAVAIVVLFIIRHLFDGQIKKQSLSDSPERARYIDSVMLANYLNGGLTRSQAYVTCCFSLILMTDTVLLMSIYCARR